MFFESQAGAVEPEELASKEILLILLGAVACAGALVHLLRAPQVFLARSGGHHAPQQQVQDGKKALREVVSRPSGGLALRL